MVGRGWEGVFVDEVGVDVVGGRVSGGGVGVRFSGWWSFVMSSSSKSMVFVLLPVVCDRLERWVSWV